MALTYQQQLDFQALRRDAAAFEAMTGIASPRRSDFLMRSPYVLSSPPTVAVGAANGSTQIAGSAQINAFEPGAFAFWGPTPKRGVNFPNYQGLQQGNYAITSPSPWAAEFWLDTTDATGRFEIYQKGTGGTYRIAVQQSDGSWGYVSAGPTYTLAADGNGYLVLVTMGAAGRYKIRFEMDPIATFYGVRVTPSTIVSATRSARSYYVMGDSFTEPTLNDSGGSASWDGWPQQLSYLTGLNICSAGSGGTGYLQTNSGAGRPKFRDRLSEVLALNPDGLIFAGGINDYGAFSAAAIANELTLCVQQALAFNPQIDVIVLSPFFPRELSSGSPSNLLATRDALKAAARVLGVTFLDLLSLPVPATFPALSTTLQSTANAGATSISVGARGQTDNSYYVQIGAGPTAEVRFVNGNSGSGPYTLNITPALTNAHLIGEPVTLSGPSYMTGTGRQGATTGSGNADRCTGNDATHPTVVGHLHIARTVAQLWQAALPA